MSQNSHKFLSYLAKMETKSVVKVGSRKSQVCFNVLMIILLGLVAIIDKILQADGACLC